MPTPVPVRAVIFDVGTVLIHEEPVERLLDRWHERSGIPLDRLEEALVSLDPVASALGLIIEQDIADTLVEQFGLTPEQTSVWMTDLWDWYCGTPNEVVRDYARSLRPRYATAILSNSMHGARREEARRYRFEEDFDPIVYSHEVGMAKPDPRIFEYTLVKLGYSPREVAFVDDRMENVEAASGLGIRAVHHVDTASTLAALDRLLEHSSASGRHV